MVIGEGWDLVARLLTKEPICIRFRAGAIQILLLHHLNPDSKLEPARDPGGAGFYSPESANKHQLLVISLNDTPARVL